MDLEKYYDVTRLNVWKGRKYTPHMANMAVSAPLSAPEPAIRL
jgi:hypothetical protein